MAQQFTTPGGKTILSDAETFILRTYYPYGMWRVEGGSEILFNSFIEPLWVRTSDGVVTQAVLPMEIKYLQQDFFYDTGFTYKARRRIGRQKLLAWGLPTEFPDDLAETRRTVNLRRSGQRLPQHAL